MKAWLLDEFNGIENLRLAEVPDPVPAADEVILDVRYAALNPADQYLAVRQYPAKPALPHILGRDGMGTVSATGSAVTAIRPGDRRAILRSDVGGNKPGTFAGKVAVPTEGLVEIPTGWSDQESAGATLVYLTAYQALTMWGPLPQSAVVLVSGASGGVGVASVQLAKAMGYTVVALSRNAEKSRRLLQLGAATVLNPEDSQWRQAAKGQLAPRRVDLAIDNIGGKLLPEMIDTLGDCGRVSLVGRLAGPVPDFNTATLFFRRNRMGGVAVGAYTNAESRAAWQEVLRLMAQSGARPIIDSVFRFEEIKQAFARLAQGPMGKVLLEVGG
ncbi:MAG TPA: zinc-binding alcohol dehydrogenase family protein [Candidatus Limnocylindrales bacterium]|nr:zinc-binding alcohol dehydrogenase family protein [Candidatus Limnocylindrales bacterium]